MKRGGTSTVNTTVRGLISLPSLLGPLMGHSFDSQHALCSACSGAAQPMYGLQLLSWYALIVHTSSGMVGG